MMDSKNEKFSSTGLTEVDEVEKNSQLKVKAESRCPDALAP